MVWTIVPLKVRPFGIEGVDREMLGAADEVAPMAANANKRSRVNARFIPLNRRDEPRP